jgi:hypothetical protein
MAASIGADFEMLRTRVLSFRPRMTSNGNSLQKSKQSKVAGLYSIGGCHESSMPRYRGSTHDHRFGMTHQMRRKVFLLGVITLGGCLPDQAKDMSACRTDADRFYQGYHAADVDNPRSQYIIGCMAAKGYDFTIASEECDSRHPLPTQPACYTSSSWLAWIIDQFRRPLKSN